MRTATTSTLGVLLAAIFAAPVSAGDRSGREDLGQAAFSHRAAYMAWPPPGGDPGTKPKFGAFRPGMILPPFLMEKLKLTDEQKKDLDALQKEVDTKLDKILTEEQKKVLKTFQKGGPGGKIGPGDKGKPDGKPGEPGGKGNPGGGSGGKGASTPAGVAPIRDLPANRTAFSGGSTLARKD